MKDTANNSKRKTLSGGKYHSGKFASMYEAVEQDFKGVQFSYKGPFSTMSLSLINQFIESFSIGEPGSRTDLFKIFVELAQNIAENSAEQKQSDEGSVGCGLLVVSESDEFFEVTSGNPASIADAESVRERCEEVNSNDYAGLRVMRRKYLRRTKDDLNNGNVGLIKIGLVSRQKIVCEISERTDDVTFLVLRVRIMK